MKAFVLLAFIPSLIVADISCPNSKITCPDDKQCCQVDGKAACCDPDDDKDVPESRMKVHPGDDLMNSVMFGNTVPAGNETKLGYCDFLTCPGKCCPGGCCSDRFATCCGYDKCCNNFGKCCYGGCCGLLQKCCGTGCCDSDAACCDGWCCKKGYRCGSRRNSCRSKGITISPEIVTLLLMAASVFLSRRL